MFSAALPLDRFALGLIPSFETPIIIACLQEMGKLSFLIKIAKSRDKILENVANQNNEEGGDKPQALTGS